jgi:ATP-dependent DNA helicase RecG
MTDAELLALLLERQDLPLQTVILLDRIQKRQPISKDEAVTLRRLHLVEGCFPNLFVAAHIASVTGDKAWYIRNCAFDDEHYKQMITKYLQQYPNASRQDIDTLLLDKLSDVLSENQKRIKMKNLLAAMSRDGLIRNPGSRRFPLWVLN